jgi:hypothetical protein
MRSLLLVPLLLLAACKSTPEATPDAKPTGATTSATTAVTELVTLKRGACFGRCPMYVVKVMSDGAVVFDGERFVATVGKATGALDAAALEKLTQRLDASAFASWKAAYTDRRMTDMATVELTVRGRTVVHYLGDDSAPEGLKQLEDDVDALVGTAQWIAGAVQ